MNATIVSIPVSDITDWESFHSVFQMILGFPAFYGRNMDAWIDCMTYIDEDGDVMTQISVKEGEVLILRIDEAEMFEQRCPEQYKALLDCIAFVNDRRIHVGKQPVLALVLSGWFGKLS